MAAKNKATKQRATDVVQGVVVEQLPVRATETPKPTTRRRRTDTSTVTVRYSDITFRKPELGEIRNMYNNKDANRFLGSFIAAPVVDLLAAFVGDPRIIADERELQGWLDNVLEANQAAVGEVQRMTLRDGAAYLRVTYELPPDGSLLYGDAEPGRLVLTALPVDRVVVNKHAITGEPIYAAIKDTLTWTDKQGSVRSCVIETILTPEEERIRLASGDIPPGVEFYSRNNPSGLVPVIEFLNDPDPATGEGVSEIARIEPYIRLYHDVLLHAAKGSKLHSVPKLHIGVEDKKRFITDNGGSTSTRSLDLTGSDVIVTSPTDVVRYLEAANPIGSSTDLLHIIFYCMLQSAETPEYILGVHMPSSWASTAEQTPVWGMKVERKQRSFASAWWKAARMILAKLAYHEGTPAKSFNCKVYYEAPDTRDKKAVAEQQEITVRAVTEAVREKLMSWNAGVDTLRRAFPAMLEFTTEDGTGEKEAIIEGAITLQGLQNEQAPATGQLADIESAVDAVSKLLKAEK